MDTTPAAPQLHGMLQMQHLVIDDVLHCIKRHLKTIEEPADHDGVVRGIVVAEIAVRII